MNLSLAVLLSSFAGGSASGSACACGPHWIDDWMTSMHADTLSAEQRTPMEHGWCSLCEACPSLALAVRDMI